MEKTEMSEKSKRMDEDCNDQTGRSLVRNLPAINFVPRERRKGMQ